MYTMKCSASFHMEYYKNDYFNEPYHSFVMNHFKIHVCCVVQTQ